MQMPSANASNEIVVVTAADDGYAIPLAVTIRSVLDHLGAERRIKLYVLDGGLCEQTKTRLLWSWLDPRLSVEWVRADMRQVGDLMVSHQVNAVTYLRILMPHILTEDVTRVIYLDADMLICRDLGTLWDEPQGEHAVLAVQEIAAPYIDAAGSLANFEDCRKYLAGYTPIANYRELGIPQDGMYFNGGMLVADIAKWRRENLAEKMLKVLRDHRQHILWWDQYALNVVLAGQWRALDLRWNQGAHLFVFPDWRHSPIDRETFNRLRSAPWIVHFCSPSKPWHYFCRHPFTQDFRRCLRRTDWKAWRPDRPNDFLSQWWDHHYLPLRNEVKFNLRAVKQAIRRGRRAA